MFAEQLFIQVFSSQDPDHDANPFLRGYAHIESIIFAMFKECFFWRKVPEFVSSSITISYSFSLRKFISFIHSFLCCCWNWRRRQLRRNHCIQDEDWDISSDGGQYSWTDTSGFYQDDNGLYVMYLPSINIIIVGGRHERLLSVPCNTWTLLSSQSSRHANTALSLSYRRRE